MHPQFWNFFIYKKCTVKKRQNNGDLSSDVLHMKKGACDNSIVLNLWPNDNIIWWLLLYHNWFLCISLAPMSENNIIQNWIYCDYQNSCLCLHTVFFIRLLSVYFYSSKSFWIKKEKNTYNKDYQYQFLQLIKEKNIKM